jgi:hypothetical protein
MGDHRLAREIIDAILRMPRVLLSEGMPAIVDICASLAEWDRIDGLLRRAREMAPATSILGPLADRTEAQLIAARGRGDPEREIGLLRAALAGYTRMGAPYEAAVTGELLAELDPPDAAAVREAADDTFRTLRVVRPRRSWVPT